MSVNETIDDAPTSKEEDWRYTPIKEVTSRLEDTHFSQRSDQSQVSAKDIEALVGTIEGPRFIFINGFFQEELSDITNLDNGISFVETKGSSTKEKELVQSANSVRTIKGLRPTSSEFDCAILTIDSDVSVQIPIHIVHIASGNKSIAHTRNIVNVGKNSSVNIVETFCGVGDNSITDASSVIYLDENAHLEHCRIQNEQLSSTHIGHSLIELEKGSRLSSISVSLGANIARNAITTHFNNTDAIAEISGVNIAGDSQVHDSVVTVNHDASHCSSNQHFVGVVNDQARSSFGGEIIVSKGTRGTNAHQTNHNLVLSDHAKADTRPWLRIFADDVTCTHGATVGRLDENALFYLRSRGIDLETAKSMLIDAFITDITNIINNDGVRKQVNSLIKKSIAS